MKLVVLLVFLMTASGGFAESHDHHHAHDNHQGRSHEDLKSLKVDKKFTPDEDLYTRMDKFPGLMKELERQKKSKKAMAATGDKIIALVQDIFQNCTLEPEPDAAIHPVLAGILQGAEELKSGKYESGRAKVNESLETYGRLFDHKGW